MRQIAGRWVVGVAFDSEAMAAKFEEGIADRYLPGVEEALVAGNGQFFELSEPQPLHVSNKNHGDVHGSLSQIGHISGRRVD